MARLLLGHRSFLCYLFLGLAVVPLVASPYIVFVSNLLFIYIILALGLNVLVGFAGQFALANAAMFGIGAYGTGLLQVTGHLPYWLALPGGSLLAMAIGTLMALPALRLSGLYLALATLAFAQFTQWTFIHWRGVTHGASGFPTPELDFSPLGVRADDGVRAQRLLRWSCGRLVCGVAEVRRAGQLRPLPGGHAQNHGGGGRDRLRRRLGTG